MAKKIRITFHAEHKSASGDYTLKDEISIVDTEDNFDTMSTFAMYAAKRMEGFKKFVVAPYDDEQEEE